MEAPQDPTSVTSRNIQAIFEHERQTLAKASWSVKAARKISSAASSVWCIWFHIAFFVAWICVNFYWKFDPYPFTALTTFVSLESIFLTCFVLISQNDFSLEADRRHKLDLQINLLAETESTVMLRLLDKIAEKMKVANGDRADAHGLSDETNLQGILAEIIKTEEK